MAMHEDVLRDFFLGTLPASRVAEDLAGAMRDRGHVTQQRVVAMWEEFEVQPIHLVRVCEAVLRNELDPEDLRAIGFCLQSSDAFVWDADDPDGERVSEVTGDWAARKVRHPLVRENVEKWLHFLRTGEDPF